MMIKVISPDGIPSYVNRAWEQTLGWTLDEAQQEGSKFLVELYPELENRQRVIDFIERSDGTWQEFRTKHRGGRILDTTWALIRLPDGSLIGVGQDITGRKQEEESLRLLGAAVEQSKEAILITDSALDFPGPEIIFVNPAFSRITGYTAAEVIGKTPRILQGPLTDKSVLRRLRQSLERGEVFEGETVNYRNDGTQFNMEWQIVPLRNGTGKITHFVAIQRDITQRKRAEEESNQSREQLRALSARLESLREEERIRISREVHDELGQNLSGLKMDLLWAIRGLGQVESSPLSNSILARVMGMTEVVDGTLASVQEIAARLRPGVLDKLGLSAAIEFEARRFQERSGIGCQVRIAGQEPVLSSEIATALFRIFQECLTNVIRHASARNVQVELKDGVGCITLCVTDDGRGIADHEINSPQALGLLGMRERVAVFGGEIAIRRNVHKGTSVSASIPQPTTLGKEGES